MDAGEHETVDAIGDSPKPRRCYLCGEQRPIEQTEVARHTVASATRGGTIQGVTRYVRMCRHGHGCKA